MDATLSNLPAVTVGTLTASMNTDGTHVAVKRTTGTMTRRGPKTVFVGWLELPEALQAEAAEWMHAESMARYAGEDWRTDRADALEDALIENIAEWLDNPPQPCKN